MENGGYYGISPPFNEQNNLCYSNQLSRATVRCLLGTFQNIRHALPFTALRIRHHALNTYLSRNGHHVQKLDMPPASYQSQPQKWLNMTTISCVIAGAQLNFFANFIYLAYESSINFEFLTKRIQVKLCQFPTPQGSGHPRGQIGIHWAWHPSTLDCEEEGDENNFRAGERANKWPGRDRNP